MSQIFDIVQYIVIVYPTGFKALKRNVQRRNPSTSNQPSFEESNSKGVSFKMTPAKMKIIGIVVAVVVLFVLGFVIGWVSAPSDKDTREVIRENTSNHSCNNETFDMKYIAKKRKEEIKKKNGFHERLFEILDAEKIGENLR